MEATLIYLILFTLLFQLFILVILTFKPTNTCCKNDCCCEGKKLCECKDTKQEACCKDDMSDCTCEEPFIIEGYHNGMEIEDDTIPMLDRPLTKKELKEMNMEEQNKEYNIMTGEDMMNMKTEVGQTASPENLNKSFRGKSYKGKHNRDYINFLDEQERKSQKDYHNLKDSEPLEENDPNINKK